MKEFNEYQDWTETTAIYTDPAYPQLALAEEVGEFLGKLAKFKRDVAGRGMPPEEYVVHVEKLRADLAVDGNVAKLTSRMTRNVIGGSGDNR